MRLNHLEISGFKSFPERSQLEFDDGVTAIVGPNGCGKSNVIDAISWVLGEQSARSLRGDRMEDIIFSGSDARRPTATAEVRLQLSQVTAALTGISRGPAAEHGSEQGGPFDVKDTGHCRSHGNGDGKANSPSDVNGSTPRGSGLDDPSGTALEDHRDIVAGYMEANDSNAPTISRDVEVGRRLYRSGESEYLIDGQVCRLRDIQDLLMDSGVGVKAYAVIEQGKIGQILGARPMERRQLLEEAAGVTKYKSRRRTAELKLEAAQQNLTRVDDIVYEIEKQRGVVKRQAAKARRYRRLRGEIRRWEKVQFTRKNILLTHAVDDTTQRLETIRHREQGTMARLAALEASQERLQIELAEADLGATTARDAAHAHELGLGRREQQIEFDKGQVSSLSASVVSAGTELDQLEQRLTPQRAELTDQRAASERCDVERMAADKRLREEEVLHSEAQRAIEGLEGDVEASRNEVFGAVNAATALQHIVDNANIARQRITDELAKLNGELSDLRIETEKVTGDRSLTENSVERVKATLEALVLRRTDRASELASTRLALESKADKVRAGEQSVASLAARLRSLEELVAAREGYSDAARLVLSSHEIEHLGSVADHLEMDHRYERAVEASLDELVQYVVVTSAHDARAGMDLAASKNAGRCGFVIVDTMPEPQPSRSPHPSLKPLEELVRIEGVAAPTVRSLLGQRWFAPSFEEAAEAARTITDSITTLDGTVFRGASIVHGGGKVKIRGILATKGETQQLRVEMSSEEKIVAQIRAEVTYYTNIATQTETDIKALQTDEHHAEKQLLELELGFVRLDEELARLQQKQDVVETDRRTAEEELESLDARQTEANQSILRLETEQRKADESLMSSQRHLLEARESVDVIGHRVAEAKAKYAALAERAAALSSDVKRIEDVARDLKERMTTRAAENFRIAEQRDALVVAVAASEGQLERDVTLFESLRNEVSTCDDRTADVRQRIEEQVGQLRIARDAVESVRGEVGQVTVRLATTEAELSNLETACNEVLRLTLSQVCDEVEQLERAGTITPDLTLVGSSDDADDSAHGDSDEPGERDDARDDKSPARPMVASTAKLEDKTSGSNAGQPLSPEDVIAILREKIDRLGQVNMMAIDQFDELEERFEFLTTQRKDLLDAILATGTAIKRINVTTRERFKEAFVAINDHFQDIFSTLFGGGNAGLVLIDATDILDSGIDIIAQPPGKRLQSIQLLSGGEKALTAMALMFAIFKFKPSPFCLLDEIDAPLDDANISRFVSMLRGMQDHTQFVLVTHNRQTMEIADQLYGVTMEEPGVSKLISVRLN